MHRFIAAASSIALLGLIVPACGSSGDAPVDASPSFESVCTDYAKQQCTALSGCCKNMTTFDTFECTRVQLGGCLSGSEGVHAGNVVYNAAAAKTCLGSAATCPDPTATMIKVDEAITIACNNVVTGYRPLGSECTSDKECVAVGDGAFPDCYKGLTAGDGVCAKHVFGDTCGFDPDSLTLTDCHAGKFCIQTDPAPGTMPTLEGSKKYYFKGTCSPPASVGQACGSTTPCDTGLFCSNVAGSGKVCVKPHALNEDCKDNFICALGLQCQPVSGMGGMLTCQGTTMAVTLDGQYCYKPTGAAGASGSAGSSGSGGSAGSAGFGGFGGTG